MTSGFESCHTGKRLSARPVSRETESEKSRTSGSSAV
jgi:hypothetical protein